MKKFVDDGMFLHMKITNIIFDKRIYLVTRTNADSISISPGSDPLPLKNGGETIRVHSFTGRTNNGNRHRVHPLDGGNGMTLIFANSEVKERQAKT